MRIYEGYSGFGATVAWALYDYQALVAGMLAIAAAWIASAPVRRQVRDGALQTLILHRDTIAIQTAESEARFQAQAAPVQEALNAVFRYSRTPNGEPAALDGSVADFLLLQLGDVGAEMGMPSQYEASIAVGEVEHF